MEVRWETSSKTTEFLGSLEATVSCHSKRENFLILNRIRISIRVTFSGVFLHDVRICIEKGISKDYYYLFDAFRMCS